MKKTYEVIEENFLKYRWFYTKSGKLVVGGKSALQNDELMTLVSKSKMNFLVMHTTMPGSPFTVINVNSEKVSEEDIKECAIFTGCFSKAWKKGLKRAKVDIFSSLDMYKSKDMGTGTWGVKKKIKSVDVELKLVLTNQHNKVRAIPEESSKKKDILLKIKPGRVDKKEMVIKMQTVLEEQMN